MKQNNIFFSISVNDNLFMFKNLITYYYYYYYYSFELKHFYL